METSQVHNELVAIVDDENDIRDLVDIHLTKSGYRTMTFEDGESFLEAIAKNKPDVIILDLMLPDYDGFELCKYLKKKKDYRDIPIIMLTARTQEMEKIYGLELGADDYITKPFSPRELVARIMVILRRSAKTESNDETNIVIGDSLEIDLQKYSVYVSGKKIDLTSSEFKILRLISKRKGWVYSREQILESLGASDKGVLDRTVDVHIRNLREKLGDSGKYIKNVRGVGYKIEE